MSQPDWNAFDDFLSRGGRILAASDRAARAAREAFHLRRQQEGLRAWEAPAIIDWKSFIREIWNEHADRDVTLLSMAQEKFLWAEIARHEDALSTSLAGPRYRLAELASSAYELLANFAPRLLADRARTGWQRDAAVFSRWLSAMGTLCRRDALLCEAAAPLHLAEQLEKDKSSRPPLLLVGFDRLVPTQERFLRAWGDFTFSALSSASQDSCFFEASSEEEEFEACARWCRDRLAEDPSARLLLVSSNVSASRGRLERALLRTAGQRFEFSLGVALDKAPLVQSALHALRWLESGITEHELDWLLGTGRVASSDAEGRSLLRHMSAIRKAQLQRPAWQLGEFIDVKVRAGALPAAFEERAKAAFKRWSALTSKARLLRDFAEQLPLVLADLGWPGHCPLSSEELQAHEAFMAALDTCGACGIAGSHVPWRDFWSLLEQVLKDKVFAPESQNKPILITGPAESAGLTADAIWFAGADESSWPGPGSMHPFLPPALQRDAEMPHATAQLDWRAARETTDRLTRSAPAIRFSYPRQRAGVELRPSSVVSEFAHHTVSLPASLVDRVPIFRATVQVQDASLLPYTSGLLKGGAAALSRQSVCPFRSFATARLMAASPDAARPSLTDATRGKLLHEILRSIWAGLPDGLHTLDDLLALKDVAAFVEKHVRSTFSRVVGAEVYDRFPRRYLEIERIRLVRLVSEWLAYEATRAPFTVHLREDKQTVRIAGLALDIRLDRVDVLCDGSQLIVDYKTGAASPRQWDLPRPQDVQLPLYINFGLQPDAVPGGIVFAKVWRGKCKFQGRTRDARATFLADLTPQSGLVKVPLTRDALDAWKAEIESLAHDFLRGEAVCDPRDYPKSCKHCGLESLCRVQDFPPETREESEAPEVSDED